MILGERELFFHVQRFPLARVLMLIIDGSRMFTNATRSFSIMLINRVRRLSSCLVVALVLLLTFTLAACGANASTTSSTPGNTASTPTAPVPTATHQTQAS